MRNILVCNVQYPFVRGGAEILVEETIKHLRLRNYNVESVSIPFLWDPPSELLRSSLIWRLLDMTRYQYQSIDMVIATKFPSYCIKHPNKVTWLFHQHRDVYDLWDKDTSSLDKNNEADREIRDQIMALDNEAIAESSVVFTISQTVSDRLQKYNHIPSIPIYTPSRLWPQLHFKAMDDFLFTVSRLEVNKRLDLVLRAYAHSVQSLPLVIAGTGPQSEPLQRLAAELGINHKVTFVGFVTDEALVNYYATCRAVIFAPNDEDYGYVTLEALHSSKPVITMHDAGGVLEFVTDGENGFIASSEGALAKILTQVMSMPVAKLKSMGVYGSRQVGAISWDHAIDQLTGKAG